MWVRRSILETEVREWLAREAAAGVDAAPSMPQQRRAVVDERAQAARERARLEAEARKLADALVNLRTDRAMHPDEYGPGEYEAARDRIRQQQTANTAAMERTATITAMPHRADYEPVVIGLLAEWPMLHTRERNAILKRLIRRVAVRKINTGVAVDIHPVWEADPWA
ncbi:hypothetical protein E4K10_18010 [Streptomyces sp. T1317-0309]|nr:hypothetical protein E4K10_18010 [Streptomyces sp. T1317-0309]